MNTDLEQQLLGSRGVLDAGHRIAHAQRRGERSIRRRKRRHHGIADRLHHGARFRRHDLMQETKVRAHQVIRHKVADPLIKRGRALEVGEQEREARDLEPLVHVERIGAIDVAKRLVREQTIGRQERLPLAEQVMQHVAGDPHRRQHAHVGAVVERKAQRSRPQLHGPGGRADLVVGEHQGLALSGRLSLYIDELCRVCDRLEHDHELRRQLQGDLRPLAGRELDRIDGDLVDELVESRWEDRRRSSRRSGESSPRSRVYWDHGRQFCAPAG